MKQNTSDNTKVQSEKIPVIIKKKKKVLISSTMEDFVSYKHHANLIEILYPSINFYQSLHIQIDKNWIIKKIDWTIPRFHVSRKS